MASACAVGYRHVHCSWVSSWHRLVRLVTVMCTAVGLVHGIGLCGWLLSCALQLGWFMASACAVGYCHVHCSWVSSWHRLVRLVTVMCTAVGLVYGIGLCGWLLSCALQLGWVSSWHRLVRLVTVMCTAVGLVHG